MFSVLTFTLNKSKQTSTNRCFSKQIGCDMMNNNKREGKIMFGIFKTLFGSGDTISKGMDLIDSFHTSDTELIDAKSKAKVELMNAYAPFRLAQRVLALMFVSVYLLAFFAVTGFTLAGIDSVSDIRTVLSEFYIGEIALTIVAFYFGGGFLEGAIAASKKKKD